MFHLSKSFIVLIAFVLALGLIAPALAQESAAEAVEVVNLDENIQPDDLGVKEPNILPGSPFYFFKNIGQEIRSAFTFNPVKKAELKLKYANQSLMEVKKLAQYQIAETPLKDGALEQAVQKYNKETRELKEAVKKIGNMEDVLKVDEFVNKFIDNNVKQQKLLGKLEKDLPVEVHQDIETAKKESIAAFSDVVVKLVPTEVLEKKLNEITEKQRGSEFKNFKNLEVLQAIEEKVPEAAKDAVRNAQENTLKRLQGDLENMSPQDREKFKNYMENIGGNETRHLKIMDELAAQELTLPVREEIEKAEEKTLQRVEQRLKYYKEGNLQAAQDEFLNPLTSQGRLEDIRIIKELENNLSSQSVEQIAPAKEEAKRNVIEAIKVMENAEEQKAFMEKFENKFYDVKQLEVLKEIEQEIPVQNKAFYEEMERKTIEKMQKEIKRAEAMGTEAKKATLGKVAGDSPAHIKILEEAGLPQQMMPQITKETIERIAGKVDLIAEPGRMGEFKEKIETKEIKDKIQIYQPQMFKQVEKRIEEMKAEPSAAPAPSVPGQAGGAGGAEVCTYKNGSCCRAGVCETVNITCEQGAYPEIEGCDVNCRPIFKCRQFVPPIIEQIEIEAVPAGRSPEPASPSVPSQSAPSSEKTPFLPAPANNVCAQVITPAIGPEGKCKEFPTPCEVPNGWKKVDRCPENK